MTRKFNIAIGVVVALALSGATLFAAAQWLKGPTLSLSGTTLTLSGKATGLGNATGITFHVSGTVDVDSRCYNRGGNKPQADNKQESVNVDATFSAPVQNGQTTLNNVFVATVSSTLQCPGSQIVVIENIDFSGLSIAADGYPALTFTF